MSTVAGSLSVTRQAISHWNRKYAWMTRAVAWDNDRARTVNDAVLHDLVQQARQLQRAAAQSLDAITKGDAEKMTVPELCLVLKTVCSLAEVANGNGSARNEYGLPSGLPVPKFEIVTFSKPDDHCWVRRSVDDMDEKRAFHLPLEIVPKFRAVFPCYPEHPDGFFVIA